MRSIKISLIHSLQPHHPSIIEIDSDELNEVIHDAIDLYLSNLTDELDDDTDESEIDLDDYSDDTE